MNTYIRAEEVTASRELLLTQAQHENPVCDVPQIGAPKYLGEAVISKALKPTKTGDDQGEFSALRILVDTLAEDTICSGKEDEERSLCQSIAGVKKAIDYEHLDRSESARLSRAGDAKSSTAGAEASLKESTFVYRRVLANA